MTKIPRLDATLCFVNDDRIELETANEEDQKDEKKKDEHDGRSDLHVIFKFIFDN